LWEATHADLIQRKILSVTTSLYASQDYIARKGMPLTPEDLADHRIIAYGARGGDPMKVLDFILTLGREEHRPRDAALTINNISALTRAVSAGLGIGGLPDYLAQTNPNLIRIFPEHPGPNVDVFFIYPADLRRSKRIAAFRQYLLDQTMSWKSS
jgi:DNA-binding transcriptional LysR family regulator